MTEHAHDRPTSRRRSLALPAMLLAAALAACTGDTPLQPERAATPDGPSLLVNPLCSGSGGTTHNWITVSTTQNWYASGNPHRVNGTLYVASGGNLRMHPGVLVCFDAYSSIYAYDGGRVGIEGADTARVVLTATDPALGWGGIGLTGTPSATSTVGYARVEMVGVYNVGIYTTDAHDVVVGNTVIRQSGRGVSLQAPGSRIIDSRVDTTTYRDLPAVVLGDSTRFTRTTVLDAAGIGVLVTATSGVELLGGRIEGSGDTGLYVYYPGAVSSFQPLRVTGSGGYGVELPIDALARGYGSVAEMDSLLGNGRDTVVVTGGTLTSAAYATAGLPWRVRSTPTVGTGGSLRPQPGAKLFFDPYAGFAFSGGRLLSRGTLAAPVLWTADDPALGWYGISLQGTPSSVSFITNTRLEHVNVNATAVTTDVDHGVVIDSAVFRQVGRAAVLLSTGSRLSRSRVDTTLYAYAPAVQLAANARLESTLIRGSSADGVQIDASTVQIVSCEVRGSVGDGIQVVSGSPGGTEISNCNLVDNG
ncbi:MAG TPA: right-handed parallel beta-helix repeat-containing protein, partial [Longimicrobium sp.]|nr:right-handed parallel beta-helix repeat-containing protein [Longimicrobium sp.]